MLLSRATLTTLLLISIGTNVWGSPARYYHPKIVSNSNFSLLVRVNQLRNNKGVVQFSLYNKDGTIPDEKFKKSIIILKGKIKNGTATVTFPNLPQGRYAVNALHDENENGKIDKGFVLPIEGVGFTNYQSIGLRNRPNFSKASFKIKANTTKIIKIIYF